MAMTRCFFTKILDEDKILYLDVDTVVDGSLQELWNIDITNYCLAGRREEWKEDYINSGVLLMNLKRIRQLKLDDALISLLHRCRFVFPDQDAINIIFRNYIKYIPRKFNSLGQNEWCSGDDVIRHFAGVIKPWKPDADPKDIEIWNKYVTTTIVE